MLLFHLVTLSSAIGAIHYPPLSPIPSNSQRFIKESIEIAKIPFKKSRLKNQKCQLNTKKYFSMIETKSGTKKILGILILGDSLPFCDDFRNSWVLFTLRSRIHF